MVYARGRPRLAPEALARFRGGRRFANHLDGHGAVEALVARRVHNAHPTFAELPRDAVPDRLVPWLPAWIVEKRAPAPAPIAQAETRDYNARPALSPLRRGSVTKTVAEADGLTA